MFKGLLASAVGVFFVSAIIAYPQDSAADKSRGIGNFSIEKVRDLSTGPGALTISNDSVSPVKKAGEKGATNYTVIMLRIIGSLVLIIALIYLVTWLMRKTGLAGGSTRVGGGGGSMDVIEVLPLGQNRNAVLFRVMDTVYLCGQTQTTIALIDKIEGQRAVEILTSSKGASTVVHFKEAVNHFISRMKK
jgi:flagellar biogenesis protein FliO